VITTLEEAEPIIAKGKINPQLFWASLGYDIELVKTIARLGAFSDDVDPGLIAAAMQMGAALAIGAKDTSPKMEIEI